MQKEVLSSQELIAFGLKEDNSSQRNCQNQLSHPSFSHIELERQESLIQGKIRIQQNSNKDHKYL